MTDTPTAYATTHAALRELGLALLDASDLQWQKSPAAPAPYGEPKVDGSRAIPNPPLDVVTDERRVEVRDAVLHAEQLLDQIQTSSLWASARLRLAVSRWRGQAD